MKKRGISTIVANVLIVLVTVAVVGVVWAGLEPLVEQIEELNARGYDGSLQIVLDGKYTFFDEQNKSVVVQVEAKGKDPAEYLQLTFHFSDGSTVDSVHSAPEYNAKRSYYLDAESYLNQGIFPVSVAVAPVRLINGYYVLGIATKLVDLPRRTETLSFLSTLFLVGDIDEDSVNVDIRGRGGGSLSGTTGPSIVIEEISACQDLDQPNTEYRLTNSVTTSTDCFKVTADNVTLNCQSWDNNITYGTSNSQLASYFGVASDMDNTIVRNCLFYAPSATHTIRRYGLYFSTNSGGMVENTHFKHNTNGIYFYSSLRNTVSDVIVESNVRESIFLNRGSSYNVFSDIDSVNTFSLYSLGLLVYDESSYNKFYNLNVSSNRNGVSVRKNSDFNSFVDLTANNHPSGRGLLVYEASNNSFVNVMLENNDVGLQITQSSNGNHFENIFINSSLDDGLFLSSFSNDNLFDDVTVINSHDMGLYLSVVWRTNMTNLISEYNGYGIYSADSRNSTISGRSCHSSPNDDLTCFGALNLDNEYNLFLDGSPTCPGDVLNDLGDC